MSLIKGKNVLITGHSGFTGNWLCRLLHLEGAEVSGFSNSSSGVTNIFRQDELDEICASIEGDVRDFDDLLKSFERYKPEIAIHLAAQPLVAEGFRDPLGTFSTNTLGTANFLEAALRTISTEVVLVITTDKVYRPAPHLLTEASGLGGSDPYSGSKAAAEMIVDGYARLFEQAGKRIVVLRGGNIIGGGDWSKDRIIPDLIKAARSRDTLVIRRPSAVRPWQHVLDLCHGYLRAVEFGFTAGFSGVEHFNIGPRDTDEPLTVRQIISAMDENGWQSVLSIQESNIHETEHLRISSAKATCLLSWAPRISQSEMFALTAFWYSEVLRAGKSPSRVTFDQLLNYEGVSF